MSEKADTIFERLGGQDRIDSIVEEAYKRIREDERLGLFNGVNMPRLKSMMKKFLKGAFGGETVGSEPGYKGRNMYEAHRFVNNGGFPSEEQWGMISTHMGATMMDMKVPGDVMMDIGGIIESLKPQVMGHYNPEQP